MTISGNLRRKPALLLSSTVGLAMALAGCTSVEVADKTDLHSPKIAAAAATAQTASGTTNAAEANPSTTTAPVEVASNAQTTPSISTTALKGGRVALPPAAEIAAAAAISAQMQPQAGAPQTASADIIGATPVAATAVTTTDAASLHAAAKASGTASLPQVVAVKGSFPPAPPPPGTPSSAPVQLTEEMVREQTIVPLPKPESTMLAYAAAPQNAALAAISTRESIVVAPDTPQPAGREKLSGLISKYASMYNVPEDLVHRVVMRESRYNPAAYNGGHFGLMQIKHATARSMGFNGPANGLFDAETNLRYAVKYLSGAWKVADNDRDGAVRLYARGYYYDAKRKGMLHVLRQ